MDKDSHERPFRQKVPQGVALWPPWPFSRRYPPSRCDAWLNMPERLASLSVFTLQGSLGVLLMSQQTEHEYTNEVQAWIAPSRAYTDRSMRLQLCKQTICVGPFEALSIRPPGQTWHLSSLL